MSAVTDVPLLQTVLNEKLIREQINPGDVIRISEQPEIDVLCK